MQMPKRWTMRSTQRHLRLPARLDWRCVRQSMPSWIFRYVKRTPYTTQHISNSDTFQTGKDCEQPCECYNNAQCHHITGECECAPGYTGHKCFETCAAHTFGLNCTQECKCSYSTINLCHNSVRHFVCFIYWTGKNDAKCNPTDGSCICTKGWKGRYCEKRGCPDHMYGESCASTCECDRNTTKSCHPWTGKCDCTAGWSSSLCNRPCPFLTYGENCANNCECNGAQCSPITGDCICLPGFQGTIYLIELQITTNTKYPSIIIIFGYFCREKLRSTVQRRLLWRLHAEMQLYQWKMQPRNGPVLVCRWMERFVWVEPTASNRLIDCLSSAGHHCDRTCDEGTFGKDCKEKCNCKNNGACHPQTGQCTCSAGYVGDSCEIKCEFGFFGFNCSQKCDCEFNNSIKCDPVDGRCICKGPWSG